MSSSTKLATSGKYTKAHILVCDKNGQINDSDPIEVLFNPSQYSIDKSNQFASIAIPGRQSPIIQFVRGESETLSLDLFFDTYTYHDSEDVRNYTNRITNLLNIDGEIHAPPVCSFIWGPAGKDKPYFKGIIEKANTTFIMFLHDGTPVRARMNLTMRQYQEIESKLKLSSPDKTKRTILKDTDSLWILAFKEYSDPSKWKEIAKINDIDDPLSLPVGKEIIIPKLD